MIVRPGPDQQQQRRSPAHLAGTSLDLKAEPQKPDSYSLFILHLLLLLLFAPAQLDLTVWMLSFYTHVFNKVSGIVPLFASIRLHLISAIRLHLTLR